MMKTRAREAKYTAALAAAIAITAGHAITLYYVFPYVAASAAIVLMAILLVILKHVGLIGAMWAWWRRRPPEDERFS